MIVVNQIDRVIDAVAGRPLDESLLSELRAEFPQLHFTHCMDDDVAGAEPIRQQAKFNLYLVDGRHHCLCFTQDAETATGLVLAELENDE